MRKHVNGNITLGVYLVDLLCLGVKDTWYMFNTPEEEVDERFDMAHGYLTETDYTTAHNIIYAGHDFAADFEIAPHKDFGFTRYILEEDDDRIPLVEIPVGDEEGKPVLIVSRTDNYGAALQKLEKHAGEGNYSLSFSDDDFDSDYIDEHDDDSDASIDDIEAENFNNDTGNV